MHLSIHTCTFWPTKACFQLRATGLYTRLCHLVGRSIGWSVGCRLVTPFFASCMYWHTHVRKYLQQLSCIRNMLLRMRQRDVAYATCCICDIWVLRMQHHVAYATHFHRKAIFLKKSQMKYFLSIRT